MVFMGGLKIEHKDNAKIDIIYFLGLLMVCALNEDILSQEDNKIIYDQAYFNQFNITNAADAIKRIPGVEDLTQNQRQSFDPRSNLIKEVFGLMEHKYS